MSVEILENSLSEHGVHWLHLVQMGAPIEAAPWLARIPEYSRPLAETQHQHEEELDLHHLRIWWPARELVVVDGSSPDWLYGQQALLWAMDKKQTLRDAIMYAGIAFMDLVGQWPIVALVQSRPVGATEMVTVYEDTEERIAVRLVALPELSHGFVLLCEEAS